MPGDQISLVIDGRSDTVVGTSVYYWGAWFVMPYLSVEGAMHDADEGAQNYNETLTLRAFVPTTSFSYGGITDFDADLEVVWDTDIIASDLNL